MRALVTRQVDPRAGEREPGHEAVGERGSLAEQREDAAVVPRVAVHVDERGARGAERVPDRRDEARVTSLGDVRDRLEQRHRPTLRSMREPTAPAYYDRRATEYDDWYLGEGLYADRERDGFAEEVEAVAETLAGLSPARTLDVACGTAS